MVFLKTMVFRKNTVQAGGEKAQGHPACVYKYLMKE